MSHHQDIGSRLRERSPAAQGPERRARRAIPELVLVLDPPAHALGREEGREPRRRAGQAAVRGEETEEGPEEGAEGVRREPAFQHGHGELLGTQRHQPIGIDAHVPAPPVLPEERDRALVQRGG